MSHFQLWMLSLCFAFSCLLKTFAYACSGHDAGTAAVEAFCVRKTALAYGQKCVYSTECAMRLLAREHEAATVCAFASRRSFLVLVIVLAPMVSSRC